MQAIKFADQFRRIFSPSKIAIFFPVLLLSAVPASAQSIADHFKGNIIRVIWPGAPGGDRGLYTVPFMKYFGRHVPGNPQVMPVFMPGAGGAIAVNYTFSVAAPDGLTIATPLAPVVIAQATGDESVKYDVSKMNWIGRISDATRILFVTRESGIRNVDDLKLRQVVVGSTGRASETFINPAVMNRMLGTKFKIVRGYKAQPEVNLAPERGETDGAFSTWNGIGNIHAAALKSGAIKVIVQIAPARHHDLADVPLVSELATTDEARAVIEFMTSSSQMGQSFVAPPGVPASIVAVLRKAFDDTMNDPEFVATLRGANIEFNPLGGEQLSAAVARTMALPKSTIDQYRAAVASE